MSAVTFGDIIRSKRQELELSLRQVSAKIDFDQSSLSKAERNIFTVPAAIVPKLADCLQIDFKHLQIKYLSGRIMEEFYQQAFFKESIELIQEALQEDRGYISPETKRKQLFKQIEDYFSRQPVEKAWLFGSFARNEENSSSDIDLLVRFVQPNTIDLFDYIGMKQDLEDLTGRSIDLVEEGQERASLKSILVKEKTLIYECKGA